MEETFFVAVIVAFFAFHRFTFSQSSSGFGCEYLSGANYSCDQCIQLDPHCAWCADQFVPGSRCKDKSSFIGSNCKNLFDPTSTESVVKNSTFRNGNANMKAIQLKPQRISLTLRPGETKEYKLLYKQAENYPVDLYYLMDLSSSMKEDKMMLIKLGDQLASRMKRITADFRLGFGSFVDKTVVPFVDPRPKRRDYPCDNCVPPYGFKHQMRVQSDASVFKNRVNGSEISGNLDAPEGGFDALMQAMMCEQIGWRNISRRIIVFSTDAGFHFAGDGRVAGIVRPNDGKCHLDGNSTYSASSEQDYPSIAQIHETIKNTDTNIIFAVTADQVPTYQLLKDAIPDVSIDIGRLAVDSSNIVNLIEKAYYKISQKIQLVDNSSSNFAISYRSMCPGLSRWSSNGTCDVVKIGERAEFGISVKALRCPSSSTELKEIIRIGPAGINEELILDITVLCQCPCSKPSHSTYQEKAQECNWNGKLICGICECDDTFSGPQQRYGQNPVETTN